MKSYISFENNYIVAGLQHHAYNLNCLLNYAYNRKQILILPLFRLSGAHNFGIELQNDLSKYYNYDCLTINSELYQVKRSADGIREAQIEQVKIDYPSLEAAYYVLWQLPQFQKISRSSIFLPFRKAITDIAKEIATALGRFTCIHVRRGDRITNDQVDVDTHCKNIMDKMIKCGLDTVYIMTNEDLRFFQNLKNSRYRVHFRNDFSALAKIDDNYLLFCIELEIMRHAARRVATFKVNEGYYDFFLTEVAPDFRKGVT